MTQSQFIKQMQYNSVKKSSYFIVFLMLLLAVGIFLVIKNYKKWFSPAKGSPDNWVINISNPNTNQIPSTNGNVPIPTPQDSNGTNSNANNQVTYFDTKNIYNYQNINDLYKELSKDGGIDARDAAILLHWSSTSNSATENDYCTQWNTFYNNVKDKDTNENHRAFLEATKTSYQNTFGKKLSSLATDVSANQLLKQANFGGNVTCEFSFITFIAKYLV